MFGTELQPSHLTASLVVGVLGLGLYLYGKRATRSPALITGLVLMALPWFVSEPKWVYGIAAGVLFGLWALFHTRAPSSA
jgi:hypothetical protein